MTEAGTEQSTAASGSDALTPQQIAEAVAACMLARDRASRGLGMRVVRIAPGAATLEMTVRDDMLNGFDICHGGFITTLADSAFAFACNSTDQLTVASSLTIDLVAPARAGDRLSAAATELHQAGRSGVYDVAVTNQQGELVAMLRGRSHRLSGRSVVPLDR